MQLFSYEQTVNFYVVWQIKPAHDAAAGESRDEKTGPRPLRGVSAPDDVTKGSRCPDRFVLQYRIRPMMDR